MKKIFVFAIATISLGICFAQVKPTTKVNPSLNQNQSKTATASPPPPPRTPTGPNGFGSIKIGMSKEALEQLTDKDGVYLSSPLTPYVYKYGSPVEGIDKFDGKITTPLSTQSISGVFSFQSNELRSFYVNFEGIPGGYERAKGQISEKYGPGKEVNDRKEEQCIYKNGSNFKVTTGSIKFTWVDEISKDERIETSMDDWILSSCPSNLRYGGVTETGIKSMTIQKLQNSKGSSKATNLF